MYRPYTLTFLDGLRSDVSGVYVRPKTHQVLESLSMPTTPLYLINGSTDISLLIYAPPCTGKTYFQDRIRRESSNYVLRRGTGNVQYYSGTEFFIDTDHAIHATDNIVITNRHSLIPLAKTSVAVLPSEQEFIRRCVLRNLDVQPTWYEDALSNASKATSLILSEDYLSNLISFSQL